MTIIRNGELLGSIYWRTVPDDLLPPERRKGKKTAADSSDPDEGSEEEGPPPSRKGTRKAKEPEPEPAFDPHGVPEPGPPDGDILESLTKKD